MKGYATPTSPYARKVRMAAIETGQPDLFAWRMLTREERAELMPAINPLGKVPVVVLDDGAALYDSPVICAYVDSRHNGPKLIPADGAARWRALRLEALGDGLTEAVVNVSQERAKPDGERSERVIERQGAKVESALRALDGEAGSFAEPFTVGEIAVACALGYMELRAVAEGWRERVPALAAWYARLSTRPSFANTRPD